MLYPAGDIIERAEKFVRLRRGEVSQNVDRSWIVAQVCAEMSKRLYARGHAVIEHVYGQMQ